MKTIPHVQLSAGESQTIAISLPSGAVGTLELRAGERGNVLQVALVPDASFSGRTQTEDAIDPNDQRKRYVIEIVR